MRKPTILILGLIVIGLAASLIIYKKKDVINFPITITELSFPFTLVSDEKFSDFYSWKGKVLVSPNDYSKVNLEKIFNWYSNRHPKGTGTIILIVFTNENNIAKDREFEGIPADPYNLPKAPNNARYVRDERDGSEYYSYDLDCKTG